MTPTASKTSGFLSLSNGETVENRGVVLPSVESSPKTAIKCLKSCFVSALEFDFATSAQERRGVLDGRVGARLFRGTSWAGGKSGGGTASVDRDVFSGGVVDGAVVGNGVVGSGVVGSDATGSDSVGCSVDDSLATTYIEPRKYTTEKSSPEGVFNVMTTHDILGRALGEEHGRSHAYLTLAGSGNGLDGTRRIHIPKVLDAGLD